MAAGHSRFATADDAVQAARDDGVDECGEAAGGGGVDGGGGGWGGGWWG